LLHKQQCAFKSSSFVLHIFMSQLASSSHDTEKNFSQELFTQPKPVQIT